jgi:hypothetical protein
MLVELCAGSAAVSMALLGAKAPCRYMGGKGRFAKRIISEMNVDRSPVVLVDPGPWGRVWQILIADLEGVAAALEAMALLDPGALYTRCAAERVPADGVEFAAVFLMLQQLNWRSKPVRMKGGAWVASGLDTTMAFGLAGTPKFGAVAPQLPTVARNLRALDLGSVTAYHSRAEDLPPIPGAVVYIDPPYLNTEGYSDNLTRSAVLDLSAAWVAVGARVGVSEAEPLPGFRAVRIGSQGKTAGLHDGPRREEWLSLSFPAEQLSFL